MWSDHLQGLVPNRVQEILLVSSAYDAFVLEEGGALTDRLFTEYSELQLSGVPRVTHVTSAAGALTLLGQRRFDMVVTVVRVEDTGVTELSQRIRAAHPELPIVLLTFDESDLDHFPHGRLPPTIDRAFLWTGDARTLLAAIKLTEDRLNVDHDAAGGVHVILLVEDHLRVYSNFLAMLYPELLSQTQSIIGDGLNDAERVTRMRMRPKILLAHSYEEGLALFETHREHLMALISDVRFRKGGKETADAGLLLARHVAEQLPWLPTLLQSTEAQDPDALPPRTWFLDKRSPTYRAGLRGFLEVRLGFGDFVFRLPNDKQVGRASDIFELYHAIETVPATSLAMHAGQNDFSTWLTARSRHRLAAKLRAQSSDEFDDPEGIRQYLLDVIGQARRREQEGVIADFVARRTGPQNRFVRLGTGSLGGKGRSVAFLAAQIVRHGLLDKYPGIEIRIPKTVVLGTDVFDEFMAQYDLRELFDVEDDAEILSRILAGQLPQAVLLDLPTPMARLRGPIAVRSSSIVEDSRFQPFAGVYATYMLPNNHPDPEVRFQELCRAIKGVYASAFSREARNYAAGTPHAIAGQKMAVVIQQVVGQTHGSRHYPNASGVAQSHNDYPIGSQIAEDGVAVIALGMGETVVSGRSALRFSPGAPGVLPQFPTARAMFRGSQTEYYAVDLSRSRLDLHAGPDSSLVLCTLADAEADGTLAPVASVYSAQDDMIRDNLKLAGPRVVSFRNLLEWNSVPLAPALEGLLKLLRESMGGEVELEFALDLADWGTYVRRGPRRTPRLFLLQARPLASPELYPLDVDLERIGEGEILCRTECSLGHGAIDGIRDIVYVQRDDPPATITPAIAREVGALNTELQAARRPYLLIGPGRWGTSDPAMGVPVEYSDIAGARVIVETAMGHRPVEHSQGTHFFQNVTSRRIGYLTVAPRFDGTLDRPWLATLPSAHDGEHVRHVQLETPLSVHLDGRKRRAVILKHPRPAPHDDDFEEPY
ncbi:MAG: PEP/pyruvate-binding domain-containing protein [Myxococcota bacterium]